MLIVASALKGIYSCFLHADEDTVGQMILFTMTLLSGAWILARPWRKVYKFLIVLFLLQLVSFKTENIDYVFGLGFSVVQYFRLFNFKPDHIILSGSYANFNLVHGGEKSLVGINLMSLVFLSALIYLRKSQKSFQ